MTDLLQDRLTELHPSTFVMRRKAVIDGFGLVEEEIPGSYGEDYEFFLRAARSHPVVNVPQVGVTVLWSKGSYFTGRWTTIRSALPWLLDRYPEFAEVPAGEARVLGQIAFATAADHERRAGRPMGACGRCGADRWSHAPISPSAWPQGSCPPTGYSASCTAPAAGSEPTSGRQSLTTERHANREGTSRSW